MAAVVLHRVRYDFEGPFDDELKRDDYAWMTDDQFSWTESLWEVVTWLIGDYPDVAAEMSQDRDGGGPVVSLHHKANPDGTKWQFVWRAGCDLAAEAVLIGPTNELLLWSRAHRAMGIAAAAAKSFRQREQLVLRAWTRLLFQILVWLDASDPIAGVAGLFT